MAGQKTENEKNHLLVCLSTPVPQHPMLNFLFPDKTEKKPFKRRLKNIIFCDMTQEELLHSLCTRLYRLCSLHFDEHSLFQKVSAVNCQRIKKF